LRLGVFGGTFDPIHLGHLRAAENAREAMALDAVAFVPAGRSPFKGEPISSSWDRYAMVALATACHRGFEPSERELAREGPSFTVDTIRALRREQPEDEIFLIIGSDTVRDLPSWRDSAELFAQCSVVAVNRPGEPRPAALPAGVTWVDGPGLAVSATDVRRRVKEGRSVRFLVPDAVADYVAKRRLYR